MMGQPHLPVDDNNVDKTLNSTTNPTNTRTADEVQPDGHRRVVIWPALLVLIVVGVLFALLNERLTIGPSWLVLGVVGILIIPFATFWLLRHPNTRLVGRLLTILVTIALVSSVVLLVNSLLSHSIMGTTLLSGASILWLANILVFSLWYWELDGGGPAIRHYHGYTPTDFLFPQILAGSQFSNNWTPTYIEYLYLAFNTSTAFSPTDTAVLADRAKALMMVQSIISLIVVAMLAARAINILPTSNS